MSKADLERELNLRARALLLRYGKNHRKFSDGRFWTCDVENVRLHKDSNDKVTVTIGDDLTFVDDPSWDGPIANWNEPLLKRALEVLRRSMVLDDLSEIE